MRFMTLAAVLALFALFVYGCASTEYAVNGGGPGVGVGIEKMEEMHGIDAALSSVDRFDRVMEAPDWIDEPFLWPLRRLPR